MTQQSGIRPSGFLPNSRNTRWLWLSGISTLAFAGSELAALLSSGSTQLWPVLPALLCALVALGLIHQEKVASAGWLLIGSIAFQSLFTPFVASGLGVPNSITAMALIGSISLAALPRRHTGRVLMAGLIVSILAILIDLFGSPGRPAAGLGTGRWIFSFAILAVFMIFFAREFVLLDLRTKIVTAILSTGGIALVVLVTFAVYQAQRITASLTERLDVSVSQLAEEQLVNTAFVEANRADQEFDNIAEEVQELAEVWAVMRSRREILAEGAYWDARRSLAQLEGGQYGNPATDASSVFVPANTEVDDSLIADLNASAYLDFSAPTILAQHPSLLAIYAIDTGGVTRYYPNIELASVLPPDFDATQRPYFSITAPLFNPRRSARWTIPYIDATGAGLVVTVAAPVYEGNEFIGIVAADMQMAQITEQIRSIRVGDTGYAFLIDDAGRIISMPNEGFEMFGIDPQQISQDEYFKHTVLGTGSDELKSLTMRMTAGGRGLLVVDVRGVETYVSFAPIETNGYSVALVVPVSELQEAIVAARQDTRQQLQNAVQLAASLLSLMLALAIAVSLGLGKVIAAPIQRLTQAATRISAGDLTVQASAATSDESGTLANAFNQMTVQLRETLEQLEGRVEERTAELSSANDRNERRARQFESISKVARTISSTRDLDVLLPEITLAVNREFGFYHVGIFLLDSAKAYAVLSAANSEGGQRMLERGHRLKVGETGLVGYVTGTGEPRVALDTGADAVFFNNPDLPGTRSELTLPLGVGEEIVGALDVQSTEPNAFSQEDINILSTLADQVSIAIQNARQFEETRKALNESNLLSRQFVQAGWQQFTRGKNLAGIRHSGARGSLLYHRNGREEETARQGDDLARPRNRGGSLALPITVHGEVIGSVEVRTPDSRPWDPEELDIVTAIIDRAAIAMENARLLAESQKRAAKERIISDISSKISMQSEIDALLRIAALELGQTLPQAEIAIQLNEDTE